MSSAPSTRNRIAIWLGVGAAVLLVAAANAHLLYVAVTSQPECVSHLKPGDSGTERGSFSAAKSACSPQRGKS